MFVNNRDIEQFDLCIFERPSIPTPERDIEYIEVKGRDGSLTRKHGFKDMFIKVELNIMLEKNIKSKMRDIKDLLLHAERLIFKDDREIFYKVKSVEMGDIENEIKEYGKFEVIFRTDPYSYFVSGEEWFEFVNGAVLNNTTRYNSLPVMQVTFSKVGTNNHIRIGDTMITQKTAADMTYTIDSEYSVVYNNWGGAMEELKFEELPILQPGENNITGNFTRLRLKSRWRTI